MSVMSSSLSSPVSVKLRTVGVVVGGVVGSNDHVGTAMGGAGLHEGVVEVSDEELDEQFGVGRDVKEVGVETGVEDRELDHDGETTGRGVENGLCLKFFCLGFCRVSKHDQGTISSKIALRVRLTLSSGGVMQQLTIKLLKKVAPQSLDISDIGDATISGLSKWFCLEEEESLKHNFFVVVFCCFVFLCFSLCHCVQGISLCSEHASSSLAPL